MDRISQTHIHCAVAMRTRMANKGALLWLARILCKIWPMLYCSSLAAQLLSSGFSIVGKVHLITLPGHYRQILECTVHLSFPSVCCPSTYCLLSYLKLGLVLCSSPDKYTLLGILPYNNTEWWLKHEWDSPSAYFACSSRNKPAMILHVWQARHCSASLKVFFALYT